MLTAAATPESGSVPRLNQSPASGALSKLSEESESAAAEEGEENDVRQRSEFTGRHTAVINTVSVFSFRFFIFSFSLL